VKAAKENDYTAFPVQTMTLNMIEKSAEVQLSEV
jgi:hypothetical protein